MTRTFLVVAALAAAPLLGCAERSSGATPSAAPVAGKTAAPVTIEAHLLGGQARLTFRFAARSSGVDISVNGVDGLSVTSAPALVQNGTFERGATAEYVVDYRPGEGRSSLAVAVSGVFGGQPRARVVTFPVGEPGGGVAQPATSPAPAQDGERVKLLPAEPGTTR